MRLFIAEKPAAAKAIADEIGILKSHNGYIECKDESIVTWARGHLLELKGPDSYTSDDIPKTKSGNKIWRLQDLPIFPDQWEYIPKKETKPQLKIIGQLLKKATLVIHSGDVDREGNALVDNLIQHFKYKNEIQRLLVTSLDPIDVKAALNNIQKHSDYVGYTNASLARARADWLLGFNLTRAHTLAAKKAGIDSLRVVGRVQTPTLRLVVDRCRHISNFNSINHFSINIEVEHSNGTFNAKWIPSETQNGLDSESRLIDKSIADDVAIRLSGAKASVITYTTKNKKTPQPLGLTLADITSKASDLYGMSAEETLNTCQSLYEKKLTTYPRVDNNYLPESMLEYIPNTLAAISVVNPSLSDLISGADTSIRSRVFATEKTNAHHAIIPTTVHSDSHSLSDNEKRIYEIVSLNYISQFYPVHEYVASTVELESSGENLKATGNSITVLGWKVVSDGTQKPKNDSQTIPVMAESDDVKLLESKVKSQNTKPLAYFTEGSLGRAMENIYRFIEDEEDRRTLLDFDGLGTSATRAGVFKELKKRNYMTLKGKYLHSTLSGEDLIDSLPEALKSPALTAVNERILMKIQNFEADLEDFVEDQKKFVFNHIRDATNAEIVNNDPESIKTYDHFCLKCKSGLIKRTAKKNKENVFWGCSNYPECSSTYKDMDGEPDLTKKSFVKSSYKCTECDSALIRRESVKSKGQYWWGCSSFPKCRSTYKDKNEQPVYPDMAK